MSAAQRLVTVFGKTLDLYKPADADAFLIAMGSYGEAARCEWAAEYMLAQRIVSENGFDNSRSRKAAP